jgi:Zn-finger nucleic acid-binding protein
MKYTSIILLMLVILAVIINKNADCNSMVKLSRLDRKTLKKIIGMRKLVQSLENQDENQQSKIEFKNSREMQKENQKVKKEKQRLFI